METPADAVPAVLPYHRAVSLFGIFLDGGADISQTNPGTHHFDADTHGFVADTSQPLCLYCGLAGKEHLAGVAVISVLDDRNIDIQTVALFQFLVTGDAMADH